MGITHQEMIDILIRDIKDENFLRWVSALSILDLRDKCNELLKKE